MTINDKIKQILLDKNLTPSYFADEIGVQRSSISHILSGRNRPSFDIIQKIIRRFPELGYEWIMEEESYGSSTNQSTYVNRGPNRLVNEPRAERVNPSPSSGFTYSSQPTGIRSQRNEIPPVSNSVQSLDRSDSEIDLGGSLGYEKKVERILIFYTDGSFKEYTPSV